LSTPVIDTAQSVFSPYPGSFGVPGVETMTYNNGMPYVLMGGDEYYVTRLNQQNATQFYDTIAVFELVAANVSSPENLVIFLNSSKAMTYSENIFDLTIGTGNLNISILPLTTDMSDEDDANITLYPNPASDVLQLDHMNISGSVRILNQLGQLVVKEVLVGNRSQLDVSHLPEGMYTVQLESESGKISNHKVSVMR
jgi:hypothetical protein